MATACSLSHFRAIRFPAFRTFTSRAFFVRSSPISHLRLLVSVSEGLRVLIDWRGDASRCFSTGSTTSSIQDLSPSWSNGPPKETTPLNGLDFEHWLVVMEKPDKKLTRNEIIDSYIKTLAQVVGSEEEARVKIYSVSTRHFFAFGALVPEEVAYNIKDLRGVCRLLPDSYIDPKNKDYGGEPFIDGQAVPYDPKYHEELVTNIARANIRARRPYRPRNYDRLKTFERRRENMGNWDFQTREAPPMQNFQNAASPAQPGHNVPPQNSSHQMPSDSNAFPNQMSNAQSVYGYQASAHGGQGYQSSPPGSQGYEASATGSQGYQASSTGGQGYLQAGPPSPPGGQGYQVGPPGSPGYQAGPPGGQAYQVSQSVGREYLAGPLRSEEYVGFAPYHGGNQASQGGPTGWPASSQGNFGSTNHLSDSPSDQANLA